jgi:hypothetical protein
MATYIEVVLDEKDEIRGSLNDYDSSWTSEPDLEQALYDAGFERIDEYHPGFESVWEKDGARHAIVRTENTVVSQ